MKEEKGRSGRTHVPEAGMKEGKGRSEGKCAGGWYQGGNRQIRRKQHVPEAGMKEELGRSEGKKTCAGDRYERGKRQIRQAQCYKQV